MKTFNTKSPLDWKTIEPNDVLTFETHGRTREIAVGVTCSNRVDVFASYEPDMSNPVLIASSDEQFLIGLTSAIDVHLMFRSLDDTEIAVRGPSATHKVPRKDEPTFAKLIPQGRRNSDLDRIMRMVSLNEKRRDSALQATLDEIKLAAITPEEPVIDPGDVA